jgi:hypothetical protein
MNKRKKSALKRTESARSPEQTEERVRRRAHELYELRGKQDGHDLDDWLIAEAEIVEEPIGK